jgi:hypothetical protein
MKRRALFIGAASWKRVRKAPGQKAHVAAAESRIDYAALDAGTEVPAYQIRAARRFG